MSKIKKLELSNYIDGLFQQWLAGLTWYDSDDKIYCLVVLHFVGGGKCSWYSKKRGVWMDIQRYPVPEPFAWSDNPKDLLPDNKFLLFCYSAVIFNSGRRFDCAPLSSHAVAILNKDENARFSAEDMMTQVSKIRKKYGVERDKKIAVKELSYNHPRAVLLRELKVAHLLSREQLEDLWHSRNCSFAASKN